MLAPPADRHAFLALLGAAVAASLAGEATWTWGKSRFDERVVAGVIGMAFGAAGRLIGAGVPSTLAGVRSDGVFFVLVAAAFAATQHFMPSQVCEPSA